MNGKLELVRARVGGFEKIKDEFGELGAEKVKSVRQIDKIFGHTKFLDDEGMIVEGGIVPRIRSTD